MRSSERIGIANVLTGALKEKARSFRGEVGNYGRGKPGRDPLGCRSERETVSVSKTLNGRKEDGISRTRNGNAADA